MSDEVRRLFPDIEFSEAAGVLEMISQNPEQRQLYEARLKFQRDEAGRLEAARTEGIEQGFEQGIEKGPGVSSFQVEYAITKERKGENAKRNRVFSYFRAFVLS